RLRRPDRHRAPGYEVHDLRPPAGAAKRSPRSSGPLGIGGQFSSASPHCSLVHRPPADGGRMRVAIITESFPPDVNGVANSVVRVAEHLHSRGHEPLVVAPLPAVGRRAITGKLPYPVVRVPSVPMPGYPNFRLGLPTRRIAAALLGHRAELVHLASPFLLGSIGARVAARLGLPAVAVYQTDVAAYARHYRLGWGERAAWRWLRRVHNGVERTLAPSSAAATTLLSNGIERVWLWRRGVDTVRFDLAHRSAA